MEDFRYTIIAKIKAVVALVSVLFVIVFFSYALSIIIETKFFLWLGGCVIIILLFIISDGLLNCFVGKCSVDEKGIKIKRPRAEKRLYWDDIEDIKSTYHKSKIKRIDIYIKNRKIPFKVESSINNYRKLIDMILKGRNKY